MKYFSLILFIAMHLVGFSQYKVSNASGTVTIDGTSTIHDWTENVEQFAGSLNAELAEGKLVKITSANLVVQVTSIKSGKSGMDDNTYKALKAKDHPEITYHLKSFGVQGNTVALTGSLTIAGVTKTVKFQATYKMENGQLNFSGSHTFKMTDFGIDPPTAVMGTIKTGDEITVNFNLNYSK